MARSTAAETPPAGMELPRLYAWRELAILGLMVMDLSWVVLWFQVLAAPPAGVSAGRIMLVLALVMVSVHLVVRVMNYLRIIMPIRRVTLAGTLLLGQLLTLRTLLYVDEQVSVTGLVARPIGALLDLSDLFPPELGLIFVVLFVGWRGLKLGQDFIGPLKVMGSFRLGFLMFLAYIFFVALLSGDSPVGLWALFLGAGIFAIGSARVSILHRLRGGQRSPFDRQWFLGLFGGVLGVVAFSAGISLLASGIGPIVIGVFLRLALAVVVLVFTPFILLFVLILTFIFDRLNLNDLGLAQALNQGLSRLEDLFKVMQEYAADYAWVLDALVALWLRWGPLIKLLVCGSAVLLVGLVLVLGLRALARQELDEAVEEGESLASAADLLDILREALRRRLAGVTDLLGGGLWEGRRRRQAAARIRQIYAQLLDISAELEKPRLAAQTPLEYLPTLEKLYLGQENDVQTITRAYLQVRYGELPESEEAVARVEDAWERVGELGRRMLAVRN